MYKIIGFLLVFGFVGSLNAQVSFFDGFNSDMNKNNVKSKLQREAFRITTDNPDFIVAQKKSLHGSWLFYEFQFCKNKLPDFFMKLYTTNINSDFIDL